MDCNFWCSANGRTVIEHKVYDSAQQKIVITQCIKKECNKNCIEHGQYGCCEHENCICYEPTPHWHCPNKPRYNFMYKKFL